MNPVHLVARCSPFLEGRVRLDAAAGLSIADYLRALNLPIDVPARIFVSNLTPPSAPLSLKGEGPGERFIPGSARSSTFPAPGDLVTIRVLPTGGNKALTSVLELAVVVAAAAATWEVGGAGGILAGAGFSSAGAAFGGAIAGGAVGLAGSLAIRALVPPPTPTKPQLSSSPAGFSISGKQNLLAPFAPIPKVYGVRRAFPMMAASPYTLGRGSDQFLRQLFVLGYGPLDITAASIGNTSLDDYEDVAWRVLAGYPDDPPLDIYTEQVLEDDINVLLLQTPDNTIVYTGWQKQTTGTDADEISVGFTFPSGLLTINKNNGAHYYAQATIQIRYAPTGTTNWKGRPWITVNATTSSIVRAGDSWEVPRGQYDVECRVSNAFPFENNTSNPFNIDCYWTVLRTVRRQSPFQMSGLAMIEMEIRASNQLSGVVDNFNCIAKSILPDWNPATGLWTDRAGSWFYDYDNQGAGASAYGLDSETPHTTTAVTGQNFIAGEVIGAGDGATKSFTATLSSPPIKRKSVQGSTGVCAFIDNGNGTLNADPSLAPAWIGYPYVVSEDAPTYSKNDLVRYHGLVYVSLLDGNLNNKPDISPTWWTLAVVDSTIDYVTGAIVLNLGVAPPAGYQIVVAYTQSVVTPGAGKALMVTTAGPDDGAAVASKSFLIHQDPPDSVTGSPPGTPPTTYLFPVVWYKASAPIAQGIRVRLVFGVTEDFPVDENSLGIDLIANGGAGIEWTEFSTPNGIAGPLGIIAKEGYNFYCRLVLYHDPDGVGGVTVEFDDCHLASGAVGDFAEYYNNFQVSSTRIPNGSFDFPGVVTSNPASHYRDVLQGQANKLSYQMTDARLDLPGLVAWWQNCNSNSRFNNSILDSQSTIFDVLRVICGMGRASFQMRDGLYSIVLDQPQLAPVQHFTPRNSWGFKSTRPFPLLPGMVKVRFVNPGADWQDDEQFVYDDGVTPATVNLTPEAIDLTHGCTDPDQAWREGRYHLAQGRLRPETYELSVDYENLICQRGDLVYVSHDVPQWGLGAGRIKALDVDASGNLRGFSTDERFHFTDPAASYVARVRRTVDGSSLLLNLITPAFKKSHWSGHLTLATPIPAGQPMPAIGDLAMFGELGEESALLLVSKIRPAKDLCATLELVDYAPAIYTADSGAPPVYPGGYVPSQAVATPPVPAPAILIKPSAATLVELDGSQYAPATAGPAVTSDDSAMSKDADGSGTPRIKINLDPDVLEGLAQPPRAGIKPLPKVIGIRVQFRRSLVGSGVTNSAANWSSTQAYVVGDAVTYNGLIWLCNAANTDETPGTSLDQVSGESPGGTVNGTNPTFTLDNPPVGGSLELYVNGNLMQPGAANDYTLSGSTITFNAGSIPPLGAALVADYVSALYWTVLQNPDTTRQPPFTPWTEMGLQTLGPAVYVQPVTPGVMYDVRMRYELSDETVTAWTLLAGHQVVGQATPPADVTNLSAAKEGLGDVLLRWTESTSPNVREYLIQDTVTDQSWTVRASSILIRNTALGAHTYTVTTIDTSGLESTTPPSVSLTTTSADLIAPFTAAGGVSISESSGAIEISSSGAVGLGANVVRGETPAGTINGVNPAFTLANTPVTGSLALYRNGVRQNPGASNDYTISGAAITFNSGAIPVTGDVLLADYSWGTGANVVTGETPAGTINGSNAAFTLANSPATGSLALYRNGVRQNPGAANDYTVSGAAITFNSGAIPVSGDALLADYSY